jgi:uncharacterized membrane protein YidH (DUF202 family)
LRRVLGVVVIAAGGAVFANAHRRFHLIQQAMRRQQPLPRSRFTQSMAWVLVIIAVGAAIVALAS